MPTWNVFLSKEPGIMANGAYFDVEFVLFDKSRLLVDGEVALMKKLLFDNKLDKIVREACANSDGKFHIRWINGRILIRNKTLTKGLYHCLNKWPWDSLKKAHSIHFYQKTSAKKEAFTLDELTDICALLLAGFEKFLGRRIPYPLVYNEQILYDINQPRSPSNIHLPD
jgi:hypothetical protein